MSELAKAVCAVMAEVRYIPETGKNAFHKYAYASDEDLLTVLQPSMANHGLCMIPSQVEVKTVEHTPTIGDRPKPQWRTEVLVTYALLHTSGEVKEIQAPGCGIDGEDKGVYKAMTGALKYALRHTFLVPTGQDAERAAGDRKRETAEEKVERQDGHDPSWEKDKGAFFVRLKELGVKYDDVALFCEKHGRPRPTGMDRARRDALIGFLQTPAGVAAWQAMAKPVPRQVEGPPDYPDEDDSFHPGHPSNYGG